MSHRLLEESFDAALLDIEGTIAPIDFVYEVMFPYVREHVHAYLKAHWDEPAIQADVELFRAQQAVDLAQGGRGGPPLAPPEANRAALLDSLVAQVYWQMDADRKTTALKSLQGKIWRRGFEEGALRSIVFDDVPEALERWKAARKVVAIYSSGSIIAQRLFMTYCRHGDLSRFVDAWFDTTTGPKREASSYRAIAEALHAHPARVLFATDIVAEADAAREAGVSTLMLVRPGNPPQERHTHPTAASFTSIA